MKHNLALSSFKVVTQIERWILFQFPHMMLNDSTENFNYNERRLLIVSIKYSTSLE
ncbi:hypothetical protein F511_18174 [Dorcoceras hygrometricum]|uniref:Uncharacterized protein n=1 Tax=Dorcoceras hygrometricum TaxID=472368 RepID=A0A2Z7BM41_9LAMI|nr:hypothetical protein F511_18174 [Dorcoceras hygrometricum]